MVPFWVTIIASLLSGLVGVIVSSHFYRKYENRKQKLGTLRKLVGNRFAISEGQESKFGSSREEFFAGLNEVFVIFHDSANVLSALEKYHESMSLDNQLRLVKAMCRNLKFSYKFNDSFYLKPFTPGR